MIFLKHISLVFVAIALPFFLDWINPDSRMLTDNLHASIFGFLFMLLMYIFEIIIEKRIGFEGHYVELFKRTISFVYSFQMVIFLPFLLGILFVTLYSAVNTAPSGDGIGQYLAYFLFFLISCSMWHELFFRFPFIMRLLTKTFLGSDNSLDFIKLVDYIYLSFGALGVCAFLVETNTGDKTDVETSKLFILGSFALIGLRISKVTLELKKNKYFEKDVAIRSFQGTPIWPPTVLGNASS